MLWKYEYLMRKLQFLHYKRFIYMIPKCWSFLRKLKGAFESFLIWLHFKWIIGHSATRRFPSNSSTEKGHLNKSTICAFNRTKRCVEAMLLHICSGYLINIFLLWPRDCEGFCCCFSGAFHTIFRIASLNLTIFHILFALAIGLILCTRHVCSILCCWYTIEFRRFGK